MAQQLAHVALLVDDYDKAIYHYTQQLNFELTENSFLSPEKRWVLVTPKGSSCSLLLAKAATSHQQEFIGNQSGGRVFLFLHTDDFENDYNNLLHHNIKIVRKVSEQPYGKVLVFEDMYGNLWDLIEKNKKNI